MDYILFGAGNNGKEVLKKLGHEHVACFVDNDIALHGLYIDGIEICAFSRMNINTLRNHCIVITVTNKEIAMSIAYQLESIGGLSWTFYDLVDYLGKASVSDIEKKKAGQILLYYAKKNSDIKSENEWLRNHIEAKDLKPAKGYLRQKQLKLVKFAFEFFSSIKEIDIHPSLAYGNLLGLIRHGGFIPWDDDLDFELLRSEYECLKDYCKHRFVYVRYTGPIKGDGFLQYQLYKKELFDKYPDEIIFLEIPRHSMIMKGKNIFEACSMDIFSIDCYGDNEDYSEHKGDLDILKEEIHHSESCAQQFEALERFIEIDRRRWDPYGSNLFFGADNLVSYDEPLGLKKWINRNDILPYTKQLFEGFEFYIPNKPEEILRHIYGVRWRDVPSKIGLPSHLYWQDFYETHCKSADIIFSEKYSSQFLSNLYMRLRNNNVYARVVIPQSVSVDSVGLEMAQELFDNLGIECSSSINKNADTCYTSDERDGWSYSKARVVLFNNIIEEAVYES